MAVSVQKDSRIRINRRVKTYPVWLLSGGDDAGKGSVSPSLKICKPECLLANESDDGDDDEEFNQRKAVLDDFLGCFMRAAFWQYFHTSTMQSADSISD
jgi:hypothetical protein